MERKGAINLGAIASRAALACAALACLPAMAGPVGASAQVPSALYGPYSGAVAPAPIDEAVQALSAGQRWRSGHWTWSAGANAWSWSAGYAVAAASAGHSRLDADAPYYHGPYGPSYYADGIAMDLTSGFGGPWNFGGVGYCGPGRPHAHDAPALDLSGRHGAQRDSER